MHLMIFAHILHSYIDTRQSRTKDILNIFKMDHFMDLMIINFKNAPSYIYVVQMCHMFATAGVSPPDSSIVYDLSFQRFLNQSPMHFYICA